MLYKGKSGYEYPEFFEYFQSAVGSVWRPEEVAMASDVNDWNHNLSQSERDLIAGVLRGFTVAEMGISEYWGDTVTKLFKKPEILSMARAFSFFEQIHAQAYNHLSDTLGINEFEAFLSDPAAQKKVEKFFTSCSSEKVSLATFSGCAEGVSLFASFAILLAFNKTGRMKGLAQIISWSQNDEGCTDGNTEFLTPSGWKKMSEYTEGDKVAQFDPETKAISFVEPYSYIVNQSDEMYKLFNDKRFSQYVTPDHTIYDYKEGSLELRKTTAEKWSRRQSYMPVSGNFNAREITPLDRFAIAFQADGHVRKLPHPQQALFYLKRERKLRRFRELLSDLKSYGFTYTERPNPDKIKGCYYFSVTVPDIHSKYKTKFFDELYTFDNIPKGFIEEVLHWDGHKPDDTDTIYYSSKEKRNVEFVQTVAGLSGYYGHIFTQDDTRWKKFCRQYRIYLKKRDVTYARHTKVTVDKFDEPIPVYCFQVPTKAFMIRRDGLISMTGNCHSDGGSALFRELVKETGITDEEIDEIKAGFDSIIENEYSFLDNIFSTIDNSAIPIDLPDLKAYIKARANNRLKNLGLPQLLYPMTDEEISLAQNISSWFEPMVKGQTNTDFFAMSKDGGGYVAKPTQDFLSVDLSALDLELV